MADRQDDHVDALRSMAAGEAPSPQDDTQQDAAAGSPERSTLNRDAPAGMQTESTAAFEEPDAAAEPLGWMDRGEEVDDEAHRRAANARRKRTASLQRQSQKVHAEQFKRTMVPLLIVTGALLFLLGVVVFLVVGTSDHAGQAEFVGIPWYVFVSIAFPMGAFLIFGAWWFYRDLKAARR